MKFCAELFSCDSRKYSTFYEVDLIENKVCGIIMYKMSILTKIISSEKWNENNKK